MGDGSHGDERVVDRTTSDAQPGKREREAGCLSLGQPARLGKVPTQNVCHFPGRPAGVTGKPGKHGERLEPGMPSKTRNARVEGSRGSRVGGMILNNRGDCDARVDEYQIGSRTHSVTRVERSGLALA